MEAQSTLLGPVLCTIQHKKAVDYLMSRIAMAEPCSVVSMTDEGKNVVFDAVCESLRGGTKEYRLHSYKIKNRDEMGVLVAGMKATIDPTIYVVDLSLNEDVSDFYQEIDAIRETLQTRFVCVSLAYLKSVYSAIEKRNKTLTRSMFILTHLDYEDTVTLLTDFTRRFPLLCTKEQGKMIMNGVKGTTV